MRKKIVGRVVPVVIALAVLLSACAGYGGSSLQPGVSTLPEVVASMGEPAMRWLEPDGGQQWAYPRGPSGTQTFMVYMTADDRLERIEAVLNGTHFARIENGKSDQAAVLKILGPPQPQWTAYFESRDELVWEWRFCDSWSQLARFDVLFDASSGIVRTTYSRPDLMGRNGAVPSCGR